MGLCKCPQRKVTNIFCYEHRVNVCEHCLMHNHPKCVVDTYRNWITDSLFSSKCGLCDQELANGETVRLLCLHIVHWDCLDGWARSLPNTTAPAGYSCPVCRKMCIFPTPNQISPIADTLRNKMSEVNWARVGLGLSLLENDPPAPRNAVIMNGSNSLNNGWTVVNGSAEIDRELDKRSDVSGSERSYDGGIPHPQVHNQSLNNFPPSYSNSTTYNGDPMAGHSYSKLSDNSYGSPQSQPYFVEPPVTSTRKSVKFDLETPLLIDEEDKYRRRSPFESLSRWLRQMNPANKRRTRRRTALYVIGTIIGMIILMMLIFGRNSSSDYEDDTFNLHANPHVLVGDGKAPLGHEFDP